MVDQRVAAEKQNGVGTPYIPPMTRRLKCRIDPEQRCMLPEHKPVRRGREMIDLLAVEEPKPKPAKNGRCRTRQRSTSCSNAYGRLVRPNPTSGQSILPDGRYPTKDVAGDRHMADGRERQVSVQQQLSGLR